MINVSQTFKNSMKNSSKQVNAYINYNSGVDVVTESTGLQSLKLTSHGGLCKTIMRQVEGVFFNSHDFLGKYVNVGVGVLLPLIVNSGVVTISIANPCVITLTAHGFLTGSKIQLQTTGLLPTGILVNTDYYVINIDVNTFGIASTYLDSFNNINIITIGSQSSVHTLFYFPLNQFGATEYIDYGLFKIVDPIIFDSGTGSTTIKGFDSMYESLLKYDLVPTYPLTLLQFVQAICTRLSWTLSTTTFPNSTLSIPSELFTNQQLNFRSVLEMIAEATGSIIYFNNINQLTFRQISSLSLETLTQNDLQILKIQSAYGSIDSIVLSREPQEDNVVKVSP